jgi:hypothetical protein
MVAAGKIPLPALFRLFTAQGKMIEMVLEISVILFLYCNRPVLLICETVTPARITRKNPVGREENHELW